MKNSGRGGGEGKRHSGCKEKEPAGEESQSVKHDKSFFSVQFQFEN